MMFPELFFDFKIRFLLLFFLYFREGEGYW